MSDETLCPPNKLPFSPQEISYEETAHRFYNVLRPWLYCMQIESRVQKFNEEGEAGERHDEGVDRGQDPCSLLELRWVAAEEDGICQPMVGRVQHKDGNEKVLSQ